jgi:nicotinamide-nucleotide amidase
VGDTLPDIVDAIKSLCIRNKILITTGGLGPTDDDLTRKALADAAGVELVMSDKAAEMVKERFKQINYPMAEKNLVQALIPKGSDVLYNPMGTAPGIHVQISGCDCYSFPGVPREMKPMLHQHVLSHLKNENYICIKEMKLWGFGESNIGSTLSDLMVRDRNPDVGTRVDDSVITVRVNVSAATSEEAEALAENDCKEIYSRLGQYIFGEGKDSLASAAINLLKNKNKTIATAESCTGGLLGKLITDISGSSAVFREGFITYCNEAKQKHLGVPEKLFAEHGAVSEPVARAMAEGVMQKTGADYGIGITGIAGPDGGTEQKPAGRVHIAVCSKEKTLHEEKNFASDRDGNRVRAANHALGMLIRMLKD